MRLFPTFLICFALFALTFSASTAFAEDEDAYSRPGLYVGLSGVVGMYPQSEKSLDDELTVLGFPNGSDGFDEGYGGKVEIGYRTSEYIAVETQILYLAPSKIEIGGVDVADIDALTATIGAKIYPIKGRLQPYGVFGAGIMRVDFEDNLGVGVSGDEINLAIRTGAGVDYYLTRSFALNGGIEYVIPVGGSLNNVDLVNFSLGGVFRF